MCLACVQRPLPPPPLSTFALVGFQTLQIIRTEWQHAPRPVKNGVAQPGIYVVWLCSRLTDILGGLDVPPFVLIQIARDLVVGHISHLLQNTPLQAETHVFALDMHQGHYTLAESHEFGGLIRRRLNRTLPLSEMTEICPICLYTHFLVWVGTVGLGKCEHSFCVHCLITLSRHNLTKCPICRASWNV